MRFMKDVNKEVYSNYKWLKARYTSNKIEERTDVT